MRAVKKTMICILAGAFICSCGFAQNASQSARMMVKTTPGGAIVKLDGKRVGVSPVTVSTVKPGGHVLSVEKQGYEPQCIGVNLEDGQSLEKELELEPILGLVIISSSPKEADVTIDGADRGRTPLLLTDLPLGKYKVKFSKPGYQDKNIEFIAKNRTPMKVSTELTPDSGSLKITSNPSGAEVIINGTAQGTTPCNLDELPAGLVKVDLNLDGYKPYSTEIRLVAGRSEIVTGTLIAIPASLTIESLPEKARIYVNNQFRGKAPVTLNNLKPGDYRIRGELEGFDPTAYTITLKNGDKKTQEVRLDGNCGRLEIITQPAGVSIYIDNKAVGKTTSKENQTDRVSNPFVVPLIRAGDHTVKLISKKHHTLMIPVTIKEGETTVLQKALKRKFIPDIQVKTSSDVITGVFLEEDIQGNLKIEVAPGVIKTINAEEIQERKVLRAKSSK